MVQKPSLTNVQKLVGKKTREKRVEEMIQQPGKKMAQHQVEMKLQEGPV